MEVILVLKKICNPFALFPFINTPSKMIRWRFLNIPFNPFCYKPPFCPPNPLLINQLFWKSKVEHTGVDITCFFQDAKSSLTKHKKCFLEASYGISQTSKLQPFTKKVNDLQPKIISAKKSTLDVWEGPKEYQILLSWILRKILTPKSKYLLQNTSPLFNNSPTSTYN